MRELTARRSGSFRSISDSRPCDSGPSLPGGVRHGALRPAAQGAPALLGPAAPVVDAAPAEPAHVRAEPREARRGRGA